MKIRFLGCTGDWAKELTEYLTIDKDYQPFEDDGFNMIYDDLGNSVNVSYLHHYFKIIEDEMKLKDNMWYSFKSKDHLYCGYYQDGELWTIARNNVAVRIRLSEITILMEI